LFSDTTSNHPETNGTSVQPVFNKVGEDLYRLESTGGYYALVKRGGKQIRRSRKTKDRKLAERRLVDSRLRPTGSGSKRCWRGRKADQVAGQSA